MCQDCTPEVSPEVSPEMKQKIMTAWADALESGEYEQATGALEITADSHAAVAEGAKVGFCCLGVLCVLAEKEGVVTRTVGEYGAVSYGNEGDRHEGNLPDAVMKWAGLSSNDGYRNTKGAEYKPSLVAMNDSYKKSFVEIAAVVREEWQDL
jgi:hypothetical protein